MMNLSYLDISVNTDSSFEASFESNRNVVKHAGSNENDESQSAESTPQINEMNDSVLPDVSFVSNTSVICISPPKHDSDVSSSIEGDNNNYE